MNVQVLKSLEKLLPFEDYEFRNFISEHVEDFENQEEIINTIVEEVGLTVFSDMDLVELLESAILVATQNIQNDIQYDQLAVRLMLTKIYSEVFDAEEVSEHDKFKKIYKKSFRNYIHKGVGLELLNPEMIDIFDLDKLASAIKIKKDDIFKFIGLSTAEKRYMLRDRNQLLLETPQFMWMRIAMGLSLKEEDPTEAALRFYPKLSNLDYIPGGSTNIGAGTTFSVLSNCYLMDTEDDIHSIYDNIKNIALISKATGGIGISVTKLRASGSAVRSNNTMSTGPIPFIKVMDTALKSMSRAGKKYGAMCIYMENWHLNFPEFMDLKQNAGDDYRRIRTANTAVYISDEFMKRAVDNEKWYMFNPMETPELTELYGNEFSKKYAEYVQKAETGELKDYKVVPAREQLKLILTNLQGTSHPWLTWKDTINLRALNNNTGTIHCSNLCTEITLPQDRDNIAVCNLSYVNLSNHINAKETNPQKQVDWDKLEDTVRTLIRHLDNLIDVNQSPLKETERSDSENRAVGMGMSGFTESLELLGIAYDSNEAYEFMDKVTEFISYISIDESANLSKERGAYKNFEGSMWSKGFVPVDTVNKVAMDRMGLDWNESINKSKYESSEGEDSSSKEVISNLKSKIEKGIEKASSDESKELYEIFGQLTSLLEQNGVAESSEKNDLDVNRVSTYEIVENKAGKGIELVQSRRSTLDWDLLREKVKKGVRNATTMAIAPNASTGLVLGTTPGLDPRFSQVFSRSTYSGKFLDINHNLVKDLQKLGIWEDVKDQVLENYGDISNIEEIPQNLKEIYKTSFQVSPYAYIEVASRAQKWIDQAISRNMYLETRDVNEMMDIYTEAWRRGLKTTYYLHVKPRHSSEQSTIKVNKAKKLNKSGFGKTKTPSEPTVKVEPEVKSKGFAVVEASNSESSKESEEETQSEPAKVSGGGGGFGFGKFRKKEDKQEKIRFKAEDKPTKNFAMGQACPTDPAERANCEACQ